MLIQGVGTKGLGMPQMPKLPGDEPNDEFWVQWDKQLDDEREWDAGWTGFAIFVWLAFLIFCLLGLFITDEPALAALLGFIGIGAIIWDMVRAGSLTAAGEVLASRLALGAVIIVIPFLYLLMLASVDAVPTAPHFFSRPILIQLYCVIGISGCLPVFWRLVCHIHDNAQASHDNHRLTRFMRDNYTKRGAGSNTIDVTPESSRQGATPRVDFGDKPLNDGSTGRSTGNSRPGGREKQGSGTSAGPTNFGFREERTRSQNSTRDRTPAPAVAHMAREFNKMLTRNAAQADTSVNAQRILDRLMEKAPAYYRQILELAPHQDNATPTTRRIVARIQSLLPQHASEKRERRTAR